MTHKKEPFRGSKRARQARFLEAYSGNGGFLLAACKCAGITRKTFYVWRNEEPFKEHLEEITEGLEIKYCDALDHLVAKGNLGAIIFKLKSLNPERYDDHMRAMVQLRASEEICNQPTIINCTFGPPPDRRIEACIAEKEAASKEGRAPNYARYWSGNEMQPTSKTNNDE